MVFWIILAIIVYIIIGIIVGLCTSSFLKGAFWIFYIFGDLLEAAGDIDFS